MKAHEIHQIYLNKDYTKVLSELKTAQQHPLLKNYYTALEAQSLYCLGDFKAAAQLFKALIPIAENKYEAITNYLAALAMSGEKQEKLDENLLEGQFYQEIALNYAICLLNNDAKEHAKEALRIAKQRAEESKEEVDPLYYSIAYLLDMISYKEASAHLSAIDATILTLPDDLGAYITLPKFLQKKSILAKSIFLMKNKIPAKNFLSILSEDPEIKTIIENHEKFIEKFEKKNVRENLIEKKSKKKIIFPKKCDFSKDCPDTSANWKKKQSRKKKKTPPSGAQGGVSDKKVEVSAVKSYKNMSKKKGRR